MFGKKDVKAIEDILVDTLLGNNSKFDGVINAAGTIRVDGFLKGRLEVDGTVVLGETGKVLGDITADSLVAAGKIEGNIYIKERAEFVPGAAMIGDIKAATISMPEGVFFKGSCDMELKAPPQTVSSGVVADIFAMMEEQ